MVDVPRTRSPVSGREQPSMSPCRAPLLALTVILVVLCAGCGSGGSLGAQALSRQSKSLRSEAAEGALLAQDAVSGKTTRTYTREHASDLFKAAAQTEATLKAVKTEHALEPELGRLTDLAGRVRADLQRLGSASKYEARALGRELQSAAEESKKIDESLE
jgi:hypothetical protein